MRPGTVDVTVLPPIPVEGWTHRDLERRIAEVRGMYIEVLENWPRKAGMTGKAAKAKSGRRA